MWARTLEVALAGWLAISPFVFRYGAGQEFLFANDWIAAFLVGTFALFSWVYRFRYAHLLTLVVATWLILRGWVATRTGETPPSQNHIITGLLLFMFAVIPNRATLPPTSWQRRFEDRGNEGADPG